MFLLPFHMVGVSIDANAPEAVGALRVGAARLDALLGHLAVRGIDAVILSTCERTELYWWGEEDLGEWFVAEVLQEERIPGMATPWQMERSDADMAVRQLLASAAGMRSLRYGEPDTLGQLRRAWADARVRGTAHGDLDALFRQVVDSARDIRSALEGHTCRALTEELLDEVRQMYTALSGREVRVAMVGAGELARTVLDALRDAVAGGGFPPVRVQLVNRTDARAVGLAVRYRNALEMSVCPWVDLPRALGDADVAVFAVQVPAPIIGRSTVITQQPRPVPARWIDCAMPPAVIPGFSGGDVVRVGLEAYAGTPTPMAVAERTARGWDALQRAMAQCADTMRRLYFAPVLGEVEGKAAAFIEQHAHLAPADLARRLTRFVVRELSTY